MKKEKTKSKKGVARTVCIILACCMLIGAIMSGLAFFSKNTTEGKFGIFGKTVFLFGIYGDSEGGFCRA